MKPMQKAQHFMTMAAAVVLGAHVASAQGIKTDNAQSGSAAEQKQAPGGLRGPDGFTPQESSPANGGINVPHTPREPELGCEQHTLLRAYRVSAASRAENNLSVIILIVTLPELSPG